MTERIVSSHPNARVNALGKKLISIVLVLFIFDIVTDFMPLVLWMFDIEIGGFASDNGYLIGSAVVGGLMYATMKRDPVAIPACLLTCLEPLYGCILYLLSTTLLQDYE
jgi:hypothetical protein